jgi:hypothetical protein
LAFKVAGKVALIHKADLSRNHGDPQICRLE